MDILNCACFNGMNNISMPKALLLFYIILASGFMRNLYSGKLFDYLENNRWGQHMLGFTTMLIVITNIMKTYNIHTTLIYSVISYTWFILTTKLDLKWNIIIIGLLVVGYLYENSFVCKENDMDDDAALDKNTKNEVKNKNKKMRWIIMTSVMVITLIGTLQYLMKKKQQYGKEYDTIKYIFGGRSTK